MAKITGGCQCGAVRYAIEELGRASICHCRMCQKAFGSFFGPLVTAKGLKWTRGERKIFNSSNKFWRGFCGDCGTPLTYECVGVMEVSIGSLDDPDLAPPEVQVNIEAKRACLSNLFEKPVVVPMAQREEQEPLIFYQHPDHDT